MKFLNLYFIAFSLFITSSLFAQSRQQIESDLVKSFKRICYLDSVLLEHDGNPDSAHLLGDRVDNANTRFATKLKQYTAKYPFMLTTDLKELEKCNLRICASKDSCMKIYSWDTGGGRHTMRDFANVIQFRYGNNTRSILDTEKDGNYYVYYYSNISPFKLKDKTYYLGIYNGIFSSRDMVQGVRVLSIDGGILNKDVRLIHTSSGVHSTLEFGYDFGSVLEIPEEKRPTIYFDDKTNTIYLPMVAANHIVTKKFIHYKFTGQYFERVKN